MSSGEGLRARGVQGGCVCEREEAAHPAAFLPACLVPPSSPPCPSLCPALAGQQMVKSNREEPCNSSCRREAGCCASKVDTWGLATACPGQEAWVFQGVREHTWVGPCPQSIIGPWGLSLQVARPAQTCRLPGTTICLAPTAKGLPTLPFLLLRSLSGASMAGCSRE